jgi:nicotinate-nucleotide adenylyltransferase
MKEDRGKKIGLFGGTFNPVHLGHLRAAEEIRETLGLNKIYFIPAFIPPHKKRLEIATPRDRLGMLKLAIQGNPFFDVSDIELKREGKSYSVDTLTYFTSIFTDYSFFLIVGTDQFSEIATWKDYKTLLKLSNFVVMQRPGFDFNISELIPLELKDDFRYYKKYRNVTHYINDRSLLLSFIKIEGFEISSTRIRGLIKDSKSFRYLVPIEVESYILSRSIYKKEKSQ